MEMDDDSRGMFSFDTNASLSNLLIPDKISNIQDYFDASIDLNSCFDLGSSEKTSTAFHQSSTLSTIQGIENEGLVDFSNQFFVPLSIKWDVLAGTYSTPYQQMKSVCKSIQEVLTSCQANQATPHSLLKLWILKLKKEPKKDFAAGLKGVPELTALLETWKLTSKATQVTFHHSEYQLELHSNFYSNQGSTLSSAQRKIVARLSSIRIVSRFMFECTPRIARTAAISSAVKRTLRRCTVWKLTNEYTTVQLLNANNRVVSNFSLPSVICVNTNVFIPAIVRSSNNYYSQ